MVMKNDISVHILTGIKTSGCPLPCLRTTATVLEGFHSSLQANLSAFLFGFSQTVATKKTSLDRFNFNDFLNFLGSNLGLWPGLGLFQLLEWFLAFALQTNFAKHLTQFIKSKI